MLMQVMVVVCVVWCVLMADAGVVCVNANAGVVAGVVCIAG